MGKRQGRHPEKALSAVQIRQLKTAGRYADGNGLYLVVGPSGAKRWVLRTVVRGKRRDIGLGGVSLVSLNEAREKAGGYRKIARQGGDPVAEKRKTEVFVPTFSAAAEQVFEEHKGSWRNEKHAAQWITTLRTYAFPTLGARPVDQIIVSDPNGLAHQRGAWHDVAGGGRRWTDVERAGRTHEGQTNSSSPPVAALSAFVFPGRSGDKPLSNMVFLMTLRRIYLEVTVHGFRSSFRDWAAEQTNFPREVCEMTLAHAVENRVEAAYRRSDLFEKRRELMVDWASFVISGPGASER